MIVIEIQYTNKACNSVPNRFVRNFSAVNTGDGGSAEEALGSDVGVPELPRRRFSCDVSVDEEALGELFGVEGSLASPNVNKQKIFRREFGLSLVICKFIMLLDSFL
uniref:Uncharacterized protein n=1 Tax=Romanomermis culicivorax TaxID=13658 RepID=A0A915LB81_ROMCU